MRVLGIESSCDETGVAIYDEERGLSAQALYSQIKLHQQYGGVVPELASRDHVKYFIPLIDDVLAQAGIKKSAIDAIAYTAGPGLVGALLTGACFAKSLAFALDIPALAVHHLEAHVLAAQLANPHLAFPFLALLVSGGHTQLIQANALGDYQVLGDTLDDAVGEAFDKTAKLLGLAYPGGPELAQLADSVQTPGALTLNLAPFPCPMTNRPGLDFSFSGLKTHALTVWSSSAKDNAAKCAIAHAFQEAVVKTLLVKCQRALFQTHIKTLVVAGGVGANKALRQALLHMGEKTGHEVFFPDIAYCTDNGAMVAYAGYLHLIQGKKDSGLNVDVKSRWPLPMKRD